MNLVAETKVSFGNLDGTSVVNIAIGSVWNPDDTVIVDHTISQLKEKVIKDERDVDGHFRRLTVSYE